jgi:hypothetical protein
VIEAHHGALLDTAHDSLLDRLDAHLGAADEVGVYTGATAGR